MSCIWNLYRLYLYAWTKWYVCERCFQSDFKMEIIRILGAGEKLWKKIYNILIHLPTGPWEV